jgi:hypothetical protein
VIFRFEFVQKLLAREREAAELLKPTYVALGSRYHFRRREVNRAA